jgi:hypothetical protein
MTIFRSALPIAVLVALAAPLPAQAAASVAGDWTLDAAKSDDVDQAIGRAVEKVNFVIRGLAHGRLKSTNQPYRHVSIATKAGQTHVVTDDRAPIVAPSTGAPVKWKREDGQVYNVTMAWKGETRLEETFANDEGKRVNVFTLNPDGKSMVMAVTVTSPKLPVPLTYSLAYKKDK